MNDDAASVYDDDVDDDERCVAVSRLLKLQVMKALKFGCFNGWKSCQSVMMMMIKPTNDDETDATEEREVARKGEREELLLRLARC